MSPVKHYKVNGTSAHVSISSTNHNRPQTVDMLVCLRAWMKNTPECFVSCCESC